jgi:hypothetical protein
MSPPWGNGEVVLMESWRKILAAAHYPSSKHSRPLHHCPMATAAGGGSGNVNIEGTY